MNCYAVIENCQDGVEPGNGFADILGLFLIDSKDKGKKALEKAENCLRKRWNEVSADESEEEFESGNEPDYDDDNMLNADWVSSSDDTAHFIFIRKVKITK